VVGGPGVVAGQPEVLGDDLDDLFKTVAEVGLEPSRGLAVGALALRSEQHVVGHVPRQVVAEGLLVLVGDRCR
jgi:hypothetical protein